MTASVIPLHRKPAYTPMDPPCQCQTPGHEDITKYPAGLYAGGRLCEGCIAASRRATNDNRSNEGEAR